MSADLAKHVKNNRGKVSLSILLIVSFIALTGVFVFTRHNAANAAAITSASDTLNDSAPSATSNHAISFVTPTGLTAGQTITVTFDSSGNLFSTSSGLDFTDMDLAGSTSGEQTLADVPSGATWGATTSGDVVITFTSGSATFTAGETITIEVGDNAAAATTGDAYVINPTKVLSEGTADIYAISIGGSFADSGDMLVAIVEGVTVSVTVDETLTFSIAGRTGAQCADYDNSSTSTEITTTATSVPFGTAATNDFTDGCQRLSASTNASSGYTVTVQENDQLTSGANQIPDGNCDGACTDSAEAQWEIITNNGFGYCMEDSTGDGSATADAGWGTNGCDAADTFFKTIADEGAAETPQNIMQAATTTASDISDIGYRLDVPGDQTAGTYTNTLTFIATPTF